ncbi:hypothetical protein COCNU_scaffold011293G000010 [Cocos nucifera]|nr:hypothetical protein [Cocos nucifera]
MIIRNSTRPGDIAEESTYIPPGHLNAPTETATVVAAAPQPSPHEGADLDIGIEDIWNLCGPLYGMANPWNAQVTDPSYNIQGFSNDDVWTADPNIIYGEASDNLSQEHSSLNQSTWLLLGPAAFCDATRLLCFMTGREGGATDESNYIPPGHPDASTNMTAVVAPAPQGLPSHDNSNNRRKVQGTENLESSTAYNLGCSDDDIHNSGPQV